MESHQLRRDAIWQHNEKDRDENPHDERKSMKPAARWQAKEAARGHGQWRQAEKHQQNNPRDGMDHARGCIPSALGFGGKNSCHDDGYTGKQKKIEGQVIGKQSTRLISVHDKADTKRDKAQPTHRSIIRSIGCAQFTDGLSDVRVIGSEMARNQNGNTEQKGSIPDCWF